MMTVTRVLSAICALCIAAAAMAGPPGATEVDVFDAAVVSGRGFLTSVMIENTIPGLSVAVAVDGRVVWSEGFGWADVENRSAVSTLTRFRIGSVSKPFTALLMATLVEQGKADFDDEIHEYLRSFPRKEWPITIRQLLSHSAGIRHYEGDEFLGNTFTDIREGLAVFQDDPLVQPPDTGFHYTSYGYNLLGAVIEEICQTTFEECLNALVLVPLELRHTIADSRERLIPDRARPYVSSEGRRVENAPPHELGYKLPSGGLLSTAEDLARFGVAHLRHGGISNKTLSAIFTSRKTSDGEDIGFGLGWVITIDGDGRTVWGHLGGVVGGCAALLLYPKHDVVVALAGNLDADWSEEPAVTVAAPFLAAVMAEKSPSETAEANPGTDDP
jgi:CubicO group peptidase (beta-lactamase class C family)